jgi:hypothetical protein
MLSDVKYDEYEAEGSGVDIVRQKLREHVGRVVEESQTTERVLLGLGILSTAALVGGYVLRNSLYLSALRIK